MYAFPPIEGAVHRKACDLSKSRSDIFRKTQLIFNQQNAHAESIDENA
jgi:hypothetical protein